MENKTTPRLWIKEREKELKSLEEEIVALDAVMKRQTDVEIANCEEEIQFIEELQSRNVGLYRAESGEKELVEMKKKLEDKKTSLDKTKKELEAKATKSKNLRVYLELARRKYET